MVAIPFRETYLKIKLDPNKYENQLNALESFVSVIVEERLSKQDVYINPQANLGIIFKNSSGQITGVRMDSFASLKTLANAKSLLSSNGMEFQERKFPSANKGVRRDVVAQEWEEENGYKGLNEEDYPQVLEELALAA